MIAVILSIAFLGVALEYARRAKNDNIKENLQQDRYLNIEKQISEYETISAGQLSHIEKLKQLLENNTISSSLLTKKQAVQPS